jgi:enterobactin synthetase component D / holo-[acyl-carrier protein] synthase
VIEEILPPEVAAAECLTDLLDAPLFPAEEALLARAVDKRRREFTTVRACARRALADIGVAPAPILPGERGAPQWPAGVVGSMTHCAGYRAAVVARAGQIESVGVDAEPDEPLPDGVLELIADADERAWVADLLARRPGVSWDRLLFCAKEAVYKTWFPLTARWLDFSEAHVNVDPGAGTFAARLLITGTTADGRELTGFAGRWRAAGGLVLTAIATPRQAQ